MVNPFNAVRRQEAANLQQLASAEQVALNLTASALAQTLREHFERDPDAAFDVTNNAYADRYTDAMLFAWLLGQYHVLLRLDGITLADEPSFSFDEAIGWLRAQVPVSGNAYRNMDANIRMRAFTVASVSTEHAVNDVKSLYEKSLREGMSKAETMQGFDQMLTASGVSATNPYYLELHYRNNMMTSYNAGRWTQIADNDVVEFLVYVAVLDDGTTELCRHLDDMVKPKGDPLWQKYWPPNHHKCRSTVSAWAREQYDALPADVRAASERITPHTLSQDSTMQKEHQFKGSPVNQMTTIPASLHEQAEKYDLVPDILKNVQRTSGKLLTSRRALLAEQSVSAPVMNAAVKKAPALDPFREMADRLTQEPDDVLLGFEPVGDDGDQMLALQYLLQLDDASWFAGSAPAFAEGGIVSAGMLTAEDVAALRKSGLVL